MTLTKQQYLTESARIHDEWIKTITVTPDPRYSKNHPTQYPEGAETTSCTPTQEKTYWQQIKELTKQYEAGLR